MCGLVRYGFYRAGKVKLTNDPILAAKQRSIWLREDDNSTIVSQANDEKRRSYSKKNIRKQYERASSRGETEQVGLTIDKMEFGLEKQVYNELKDKFYNTKTVRNGKNHKKWHRNHRDCYSNREVVYD